MKYNKLVMKCKKVSSEEERLVGAKKKFFFEIICVETFFEATSKKKKSQVSLLWQKLCSPRTNVGTTTFSNRLGKYKLCKKNEA